MPRAAQHDALPAIIFPAHLADDVSAAETILLRGGERLIRLIHPGIAAGALPAGEGARRHRAVVPIDLGAAVGVDGHVSAAFFGIPLLGPFEQIAVSLEREGGGVGVAILPMDVQTLCPSWKRLRPHGEIDELPMLWGLGAEQSGAGLFGRER